jgi:hypothetical protein
MKDGILDRKIRESKKRMENEVAAVEWPRICRALGNLPPTPTEISLVKELGMPKGFGVHRAGIVDRWRKSRISDSVPTDTKNIVNLSRYFASAKGGDEGGSPEEG